MKWTAKTTCLTLIASTFTKYIMTQMPSRRQKRKRRRRAAEDAGDSSDDSDGGLSSLLGRNDMVQLKDGVIYFFSVVDQRASASLTKIVTKLSHSPPTDPVVMHLCSPGGDLDGGMLIYDLLRTAPFDVHVRVHGECMSAATLVALGGVQRHAMPHATVMFHNLSHCVQGSLLDVRVEQRNADRMTDMMRAIYLRHLRISDEWLDRELSHDGILDVEQALEIGFITHLVPERKIHRWGGRRLRARTTASSCDKE